MQHIDVKELAILRQQMPLLVLDVREPWELELASFEGALSIPMNQVPERFEELDKSEKIVCLCHHGARSLQVAQFLSAQGFKEVYNLSGGIDAWSREIDDTVATY